MSRDLAAVFEPHLQAWSVLAGSFISSFAPVVTWPGFHWPPLLACFSVFISRIVSACHLVTCASSSRPPISSST
ncbi:hypothetical protein DFJ58DRAFT_750966 [Suillus subalutaceus]|uniref:uncharacterized protein n=1 Tax=Suillus subalutaceus TaxID=48586 RepID=UPI001B8705EC|nr:uncharacterized protein DFJ58DRAFT_750966 [Suillus subalutaceus]KAG1828054.1 hypothetical protein DFJ58DRAFT_750966 [Suillus subalutaceus]